jgi:plasmid stabilization system protein ParE
MARLEFHRLADRELNEAAEYYDLENPGLGASFLKEVDRCLQSIEDQPEAGVKPSSIRILAVMNLKRRPTCWVGRE